MAFDDEIMQSISAICKYLYKNPNSHKNTVRKELVGKNKISNKEKFSKVLESLIALGKISIDKNNVSLSPEFIKTGVLQKQGNEFFIISQNLNKQLKINKSIA